MLVTLEQSSSRRSLSMPVRALHLYALLLSTLLQEPPLQLHSSLDLPLNEGHAGPPPARAAVGGQGGTPYVLWACFSNV